MLVAKSMKGENGMKYDKKLFDKLIRRDERAYRHELKMMGINPDRPISKEERESFDKLFDNPDEDDLETT